MDVDDYLYDDLTSIMQNPADYSLDDLDEILRSTDTHLDSSIDFNTFVPQTHTNNFLTATQPSLERNYGNQLQIKDEGFEFNSSTFPSPAVTNKPSSLTQSYDGSQRTSSTSSMDSDHFNPDEFLNMSFSSDIINIDEFTCDSMMELKQRNTPSPTGSCSSSGDSSTSGIQSDASSVTSMSHINEIKPAVLEHISFDIKDEVKCNSIENKFVTPPAQTPAVITSSMSTIIPFTMPLLQTNPIIQPIHSVQQLNVVPSTIIPIKTVPITSIKTTSAIKVEPKLMTKTVASQPIKTTISTAPITIKTTNNATKPAAATTTTTTTTPNSKPKTIYLSTNDFKALMQKMNSNQKNVANNITNQIPKIVMKAPNGKMITTASKIVQPVTNVVTRPPQIVKTNGSVVTKQHTTKVFATNTQLPAANRVTDHHHYSHHSFYKGMVDEKMLKKQQRMIKNRESASLSRKKKKEYVTSLESRINNLEKENCTLKGENASLRSQLVAFAQTCQCKHTNVSEFILNSLNVKCENSQHVKIAPKPAFKNIKPRMTAASVKRNVAVLFAMAFMVTMNVGNFQTYLNKNAIENSADTAAEEPTAGTGRHLLWVESEAEFNEKLNLKKRDSEMEVPPLNFFRPANRSNSAVQAAPQQLFNSSSEKPPSLAKCGGTSSNQTENLRLARDLHKWIDGNGYLNLSLHEKLGNVKEPRPIRFGMSDDLFNLKTIDLPLQRARSGEKRTFLMHDEHIRNKQRKLETDSEIGTDNELDNDDNENGQHSMDIFKPKISDEYMRLFKGIKRQDDTFYVLSFNMDHILLPASVYNKSSRPKMSLMLPTGDPSMNGDIVLMQIDCEVVNTTELQIKSHMIPEKLRPIKYGPANLHPTPNPNDVANNETTDDSNKAAQNAAKLTRNIGVGKAENHNEQIKIKPYVRTVSVIGPKFQEIDGIKRKPTIIKLSSNDSVIGSGVFKIKNSTLFSKMRETVGQNVP